MRSSTRRRILGLVALLFLIGILAVLSLAIGARPIAPDAVVRTLVTALSGHGARTFDDSVILTERVPRTVVGLVVGLCLGASGAIMQAITRNPLVDGGILGVELGAACAVVAGILFFHLTTSIHMFWFALAGAIITAAVVFTLSRFTRTTSTAISLVIAGAATSAMLVAISNLMIIRDESAFARYRF